MRLTGGRDYTEGRVEIFANGTWGTICDTGWDLNTASIVCRQLGLQGARLASTYSFPFLDNLDILLGDLMCVGDERTLLDCQRVGLGNCDRSKDAAVVCESKIFYILLLILISCKELLF